MKTIKTTLAVTTAALLALALFASPSSAASGVDDQAAVSGSLNPCNDASGTAINPPPTSFEIGQVVRLQANFNGGARAIRLYKKAGATTLVATVQANSSGNAYFNYTVTSGAQQLWAEDPADQETETDTYTGNPPAPSEATLVKNDSLGKSWTASFDPTVNGQSSKLEVREVCTYETDETNPESGAFDEDQPQDDCKGAGGGRLPPASRTPAVTPRSPWPTSSRSSTPTGPRPARTTPRRSRSSRPSPLTTRTASPPACPRCTSTPTRATRSTRGTATSRASSR